MKSYSQWDDKVRNSYSWWTITDAITFCRWWSSTSLSKWLITSHYTSLLFSDQSHNITLVYYLLIDHWWIQYYYVKWLIKKSVQEHLSWSQNEMLVKSLVDNFHYICFRPHDHTLYAILVKILLSQWHYKMYEMTEERLFIL